MPNLQYAQTDMKYNELKLSTDQTHFTYKGENIFGKTFLRALKFHAEGLAAVCDHIGWYHIDMQGNSLYAQRYTRAFGYYCNRATVVDVYDWFHINTEGNRVYTQNFAWCGNFQENVCSVKNLSNQYFHIDLNGNAIYEEKYRYVGDFKDGFACVRLESGLFKHIDSKGYFLNDKMFVDLGIFHKGIANAKDSKGWFHADKNGDELYPERYQQIEVFYNGFALVETFDNEKIIINEQGETILTI